MDNCTVEVGLLRKKPCGNAAVAHCLNCEQPLCVEHALAQHSESGQKTGKFMCKECQAAAKAYEKNMAAVARSQEAKKPAASAPKAAEQPAPAAAAEAPKPSEALEFPSKDGKPGYTTKKD